MIFNFIFFTVKIEKNHMSVEKQIAQLEQERRIKARAEAHMMEAASYPEFATRS